MYIVFLKVSSSQRNSCQLTDAYMKNSRLITGRLFLVYAIIVSRRAFVRLRPDIVCEVVMTLV